MEFMKKAMDAIRSAGEEIPIPVSGLISNFLQSLDAPARELVTGLQFTLDDSAALIGSRGIPSTPFVVNRKLFQLEDPNREDPIPSDVLGIAALKLIQLPMIGYRSEVITRMKSTPTYVERLKDPEVKDFFDGLVEFGCYMHLVQSIRASIKDTKVEQRICENRKNTLKVLSQIFAGMEGYEPLSQLITFALSDDEGFPTRMELALKAASSPIYGDSAFLSSSFSAEELGDRRFLAHKFFKKLIQDVGGIQTASKQELGKLLREKLDRAESEDQVVTLIAELAALENLALNPFTENKPQNYQEWIDLVASKDRWEAFSRLSPNQQFELLMRIETLYEVHQKTVQDLEYLNPLFDILSKHPRHQSGDDGVTQDDLNDLLGIASQLPDYLEGLELVDASVQPLIKAIDFFDAYQALDVKDEANVRQVLLSVYGDFDLPVEVQYESRGDDSRLKLDIKELSMRFTRGELEPIDVLKILQLFVSSGERMSAPDGQAFEYPTNLATWLKYVIDKGHTHSFGSFAGRGIDEKEAVARIGEFAELLKFTLPLFALADNLREWDKWQDHMGDPLVAGVTLIAFESKLDVIRKTLESIKERALVPGDIFNEVMFAQSFPGLTSTMEANALKYRDQFAERTDFFLEG